MFLLFDLELYKHYVDRWAEPMVFKKRRLERWRD